LMTVVRCAVRRNAPPDDLRHWRSRDFVFFFFRFGVLYYLVVTNDDAAEYFASRTKTI
jgi:hypothetical protein